MKQDDHSILSFIKQTFQIKSNVKTLQDLVNTKMLYDILIECDYKYFFGSLNLTFDTSFGILFTEISEILVTVTNYIVKSGVSLTNDFEDLKQVNTGSLISGNEIEIMKLLELVVLAILNCANKESFIDKLLLLDEHIQSDILNIVEQYIVVEERYSLQHSPSKSKPYYPIINENSKMKFDQERNVSQEELSEAQTLIKELKLSCDKYEENVNELEKKIARLTLENDTIKIEHSQLKLENINLKKKVDKKDGSADFNKLEEIKTLRSQFEEQRRNYQSKTEKLTDEIEMYKNKLAAFDSQKSRLDQFDAMKEKVQYYENVIKSNYDPSVISNIKLNEKELREKGDRITELLKKNELLESQKAKLEQEINELQTRTKKEKEVNLVSINYNEKHVSRKEREKDLNKVSEIDILLVNKTNYSGSKLKKVQKNFNSELFVIPEQSSQEELVKEIALLKERMMAMSYDNEVLTKENAEMKTKYEREFELVTSAVYNLGVQHMNMKADLSSKLKENPPWLIKERQKFFNGDI